MQAMCLSGYEFILRYEDLQYEKQTDFVITSGEKTHFMMTLFQDSFEKAEDELHQMFRNAPEDVSPVKFAAMDLLLGCMKFPISVQLTVKFIIKTGIFLCFRME